MQIFPCVSLSRGLTMCCASKLPGQFFYRGQSLSAARPPISAKHRRRTTSGSLQITFGLQFDAKAESFQTPYQILLQSPLVQAVEKVLPQLLVGHVIG